MRNINKIFIVLIMMGFWMSGCDKYLDVNTNPNGVSNPSEASLLASITNSTGMNVFRVTNLTGNYVQYFASSNADNAADTYNHINGSGTWDNLYHTMSNLSVLQKKANENNLPAYNGMANILMAFNLSMVINIWGDAPYQEAFTGEHLNPVFEKQEDLYNNCLQLIEKGLADLKKARNGNKLDAASDFIHHGNIDEWVKTGYALRARLLNLVSKTGQYDATQVLKAIDSAYVDNDDDAEISKFDTGNPWKNIAFDNENLTLGGWLSAYFIDALNGNTFGLFDPRLPLITDTTEDGNYRGTPNGKGYQGPTNSEDYECYLEVGKWYSSSSSPLELLTYAEMEFTKAEAAFRNSDKPTAYQAYLDGIKANMEKMGVAQNEINDYLSDPSVAVGQSNISLELIMEEKYKACFLMSVTWDDMRRMDYQYKDFNLPANATLGSHFIRRLNYPDDEVARNGSKVPEGVKRDDHLWWDE